MGFFDKVRDLLTSSDAGRAKRAPRAADKTTAAQPADAAVAQPAQPEQEADARQHRTHTVVRGDTLVAIADHYGVDWREMAELNQLDNPDLIYPGQVFRVPGA